ncbi:MAG: class I tRNA ligase family protein, partial [bacterium]
MDDGIPKIYETKEVESKWYGWWEERGYFHPEPNPDQPYYSVTIPPPNVTGSLHMGHALNHSIIDALIRWNRMKGLNTLCLPGTDHAGIATQNVVEKELRKDHTSRYDLGREKFIERIWEWVDVYGSTIINQLKSLGCSYDWQRLRFTLDKDYADAVLEVFVRWWNDERLYLGSRVVNWCPRCRTVISDIEVANEERNGFLWHIRYPFEDGTGYVTVATTRPETMLGDVAVAVNPEDTRYKHLVGKTLRLPLVNRSIPLVPDPYPDPEFGSGAVKITPSHDPNDFEVGKRHNLQMPVVIAKDATIDTRALRAELGQEENESLLSYQGLDRYEARERIVEDLKKLGLLDKVEPHKLAIGICDRCHTVIEPLLSEQWFANMADIAKPAIDVVKEGRIRFIPDRYVGVYLNWMENIR